MDLTKFGFTTSAVKKKKSDDKDVREKKKAYEAKRERNFQSSWLQEFPGLMYATPIETSESTEEGGEKSDNSTDVMFCKTCLDAPECTDKTSSLV